MLWFFVIVAVLVAAAGAFYWRWRKRVDEEIAEGAALEWAQYQKNEPEFVEGLSEEKFRAVYDKVHRPRFPGYALAIVATFFAALPVIFIALSLALWGAGEIGLIPEPVEVADRLLIEDGRLVFFRETPPEAALYYIRDLGGFYYFFGVLAVWLVIVWFYMRRFHARRPGYMRDEVIRAREK